MVKVMEPSVRDLFMVQMSKEGVDAWDATTIIQKAKRIERAAIKDCNVECLCKHKEIPNEDPSKPSEWVISRMCRMHKMEENAEKAIEAICAKAPKRWRVVVEPLKDREGHRRGSRMVVFIGKVGGRRWPCDNWVAAKNIDGKRTWHKDQEVTIEHVGMTADFTGDPRGYTTKLHLTSGGWNTWGGFESGWGVPTGLGD